MSEYTAVNILDMVDAIGEEDVNRILSDFSCPKNDEIERFVRNNALDFAKRKMSITHLVMDTEGQIVAIFALTHKAVEIKSSALSSTAKKKVQRFAQIDEQSGMFTVSAFLIAQFGKNYEIENNTYSGQRLMEAAFETLAKVQRDVGGGVVYLECEDKPQLLKFYENDNNRFRRFGERYSDTDKIKYIQLLRFF